MAHGQLLLDSVLCFLVNMFRKIDVKSLKQLCLTSAMWIQLSWSAKLLLMKDQIKSNQIEFSVNRQAFEKITII